MQKPRILSLLFTGIMLFSFAGCSAGQNNTGGSASQSGSKNDASMSLADLPPVYAYTLTEATFEDEMLPAFHGSYPFLKGEIQEHSNANELLRKAAIAAQQQYRTDADEKASCETTYSVTFQSEYLISVLFITSYTSPDAPYPTTSATTFNIELQDDTVVGFEKLIDPNDAFYQALIAVIDADKELTDAQKSALTFDLLKEATGQMQVYFTNDGVGVTFPVLHALGDHIELVVPYLTAREFMENT